MPTTVNHNINIDDTVSNWLKWGNLVLAWAKGHQALPTKKSELEVQMNKAGVMGTVKGDPERGITFVVYPKNGAITIPLPNDDMLKLDEAYLRTLTHNGTQPAAYPLQSFYAVCFGGAAEVPLSLQEMLDMEARRVGEYVINECM